MRRIPTNGAPRPDALNPGAEVGVDKGGAAPTATPTPAAPPGARPSAAPPVAATWPPAAAASRAAPAAAPRLRMNLALQKATCGELFLLKNKRCMASKVQTVRDPRWSQGAATNREEGIHDEREARNGRATRGDMAAGAQRNPHMRRRCPNDELCALSPFCNVFNICSTITPGESGGGGGTKHAQHLLSAAPASGHSLRSSSKITRKLLPGATVEEFPQNRSTEQLLSYFHAPAAEFNQLLQCLVDSGQL